MRVLYVCWEFPALSESFVSNEVAMVRARGHDVRVLSMKATAGRGPDSVSVLTVPWPEGLRSPWLTAHALAGIPRRRLTERWTLEVAAAAIAAATVRSLGSWQPEVIHCHFVGVAATVALRIGTLTGTPCTVIAHAADWTTHTSARELRWKATSASATLAISEDARQGIATRSGVDADGIVVQRAVFRTHPTTPETAGSADRIACVARLVPKKGIDTLIAAMPAVRAERRDVQLTIVGSGPLAEELAAAVTDLGLQDCVTLAGAVDHAAAQAVTAGAAVFVLPCRRLPDGDADGIPVALMEAVAHRVPVVSTNVAGIPELIPSSREGLLVAPDDPHALAEAVVQVLRDPNSARAMADRALDHMRTEFDAELQVDRLEKVWADVVTAPSRKVSGQQLRRPRG